MSSAAQRYEISTRLAVGDAGLVYKAVERASGRAVAMKLLLPEEQISHPLDVEALLRDAPGISQLTGGNIVQLLDAFPDEDGTVLVYEFAEGIRGLDVPGTCPIPAAQAVDVASQLLTALSCGEVQHYPHGDLKPSDVLLVQMPDRRPLLKVLDWGLANYRREPTPAALAYTAPERLAGDPPSHSADLFSAGAVLYYLFTGRPPVNGRSKEEFATAWHMLNPHNLHNLRPELPPALIDWIARLLQANPSNRPASAIEALGLLASVDTSLRPVAAEKFSPSPPQQQSPPAGRQTMILRPALHPAAVGTSPPMGYPGQRFAPPRRKKRSPALLVTGFLVLALLGGGGFLLWQNAQTNPKPKLAGAPTPSAPKPPPIAAPSQPPPKTTTPSAAPTPPASVAVPPPVVAVASPPAPVPAPLPPPPPQAAPGTGSATFTSSPNPPTVDAADIANFAAQTETDKWFFQENDEKFGADSAKGLTFTTSDDPVVFKALTYKIATGSKKSATPANPTTWTIRIGTLSGNKFTQISSEQAQQTADTGDGDYMTWTFSAPLPLAAHTTYAVDVAMRSRTDWKTGIPYLACSPRAAIAGLGISYHSGDRGAGDSNITKAGAYNRVVHLDLAAK